MKKAMSAILSLTLTATSLLGTAAFQASAADAELTFDIRSGESNEIVITAEQIANGDFTVPVNVFIPENPGVNGIHLKLQINDGEVSEDGTFNNYGFYFSEGDFADPFCFTELENVLPNIFNADKMNMIWSTGLEMINGISAFEDGTSAWDSAVSWAYDAAFATAQLVVPQGTPAGEYKLDVRTDSFQLGGSAKESKSSCTQAEDQQTRDLQFNSIPLTIKVEETKADPAWEKDYAMDTTDLYYIVGDVSGAPGSTVEVPVYIYNDPGTAGLQAFFSYDKALTLKQMIDPDNNYAYMNAPEFNEENYPATYAFAGAENLVADNGSILTILEFTIPTDAAEGTTYNVGFYPDGEGYHQKTVDRDKEIFPKRYDGSITVVSDSKTALNHTTLYISEIGETASLNLFNAPGAVAWSSSDPSVATVDANGFVTATGSGTATITATNNGTEYTAAVSVNSLFGDVDSSGVVDSLDAQATLSFYVDALAHDGVSTLLTPAQQKIADVDLDGTIGALDAQYILVHYLEVTMNHNTDQNWQTITKNPNTPAE
ncbi:MAG: Ig-like domain-containing protein [Oscillospiraceae bacterium]|nr:Ig-like domain-containing protein [Oscillospiraceae bacterium]